VSEYIVTITKPKNGNLFLKSLMQAMTLSSAIKPVLATFSQHNIVRKHNIYIDPNLWSEGKKILRTWLAQQPLGFLRVQKAEPYHH
jgi:hypothetical protein